MGKGLKKVLIREPLKDSYDPLEAFAFSLGPNNGKKKP